jgi:tetratricopeptide (TPR) repeat protein
MTSRSSLLLAALLSLAVAVPGRAAEAGPRTLAVADFAVRVPEEKAAESAWLGPAVAELLQAKMQLFSGARLVERMRLATLVAAAGRPLPASGEGPPDGLALIPADILVAGSIEVAPGTEPQRIKIRARAFETQTSKIISDAVVEETSELPGLLKVTEGLAEALAAGLGLAFTPEQLVYAEPASIDTLKAYLAGNGHFLGGRYRDAVDAYQRAQDGNAGRYYAAAHRMQGEAYQALAKGAGSVEGEKVREEYLRKFREDALVASGALFDLGLAYEANAMWKEAVDTFEDYLKAAGREGETVRWRRDLGSPDLLNGEKLHEGGSPKFIVDDENRLHFISRDWWLTLDASTGATLGKRSLLELIGETPEPGTHCNFVLGGIEQGILMLVWTRSGNGRGMRYFNECWAAAIGPDMKPRWKRMVAGAGIAKRVWRSEGRTHIFADIQHVDEQGKQGSGIVGYDLLTLDTDGQLLSRIALPLQERDHGIPLHGPDLRGFSSIDGTLAMKDGLHRLTDGSLIRNWEMSRELLKSGGHRVSPRIEYPTGMTRVTWAVFPEGVRIFQDRNEVLALPGATELTAIPQGTLRGALLFDAHQGYLLVDTANWTVVTLFGDLKHDDRPYPLAAKDGRLLFGLGVNAGTGGNPSYALPADESVNVLLLVETPGGLVVGKYRAEHISRGCSFFLGTDLVSAGANQMIRSSLAQPSGVAIIPAAEAHLRMAGDLLHLELRDEARGSLEKFDRELPGDPRAYLVRLELAKMDGKNDEASQFALKALVAGFLSREESAPLLDAIRKVHPEVRDALVTPVKSGLELLSMAGPGTLVAAPYDGQPERKLHLLVDTATGETNLVPTPEFTWAGISYDGAVAYGRSDARDSPVVRIDLRTGERTRSGPLPLHDAGSGGDTWVVPGFPIAVCQPPAQTAPASGGLGITIGIRNDVLTVIAPIEDSPAWKIGIKAGDQILKVNAELTRDMSVEAAVKKMRGVPGTSVTITVMREGLEEPKDYTIVRDTIRLTQGQQVSFNRSEMDLLVLDPVTLVPLNRVMVHRSAPSFIGNGLVVFAPPPDTDAADNALVVVIEQETGRERLRQNVPLHRERLVSAVADADELLVTINGGDMESLAAGGKGNWYRVESYPIGSRGKRWTYEAEGWVAGNAAIEGDRVSLPAYEGRFKLTASQPPDLPGQESREAYRGPTEDAKVKWILHGSYPLQRVSIDRRTGQRLAGTPMRSVGSDPGLHEEAVPLYHGDSSWFSHLSGGIFTPIAGRRIFPGRDESIWDEEFDRFEEFWFYAPGREPVLVRTEFRERDYRVLANSGNPAGSWPRRLSWGDLVLESIGGGVILVKDFAKGKGLDILSPLPNFRGFDQD